MAAIVNRESAVTTRFTTKDTMGHEGVDQHRGRRGQRNTPGLANTGLDRGTRLVLLGWATRPVGHSR